MSLFPETSSVDTQPTERTVDAAIADIEREFQVFITQIRRTSRNNAHQVSDGMLPGAYKVLTSISYAESITLSELTEKLMVDKGQMSRTVRELDERGLITRAADPNDRRSVLLAMSDYGAERLAEVLVDQKTLLRSAMQEWPVTDIDRFAELLHALAHGSTPQ